MDNATWDIVKGQPHLDINKPWKREWKWDNNIYVPVKRTKVFYENCLNLSVVKITKTHILAHTDIGSLESISKKTCFQIAKTLWK